MLFHRASFFFLVIDLNFLIVAMRHLSNSVEEFAFPLEISTKDAKGEMEMHTVIAKLK